jgi:hypothetical protein
MPRKHGFCFLSTKRPTAARRPFPRRNASKINFRELCH